MNIQESRKNHLDILRIISIILVIACHTIIYRYHTLPSAGTFRPLYIGVTILLKTGVPTMFMISGALLIPKEESFSVLLKKRILRYLIVLFVFSLISYLYSVHKTHDTISWWIFFSNFYSFGQVYSYWFLYQYLAYLISLPFLRKMAKAMSQCDFYYMFIIWILLKNSAFIAYRIFGMPMPYSDSFTLFIMEHQVFFPLAGYFLEYRLDKEFYTRRDVAWIAFIAAIASIIITSLIQNHYWVTSSNPEQEAFLDALVFVPAIINFFLVKRLLQKMKLPKKVLAIISWLSSCTFGIYLMQHIYLDETLHTGEHLCTLFGPFFGSFSWVLLVFIIGIIITSLLKLVPVINKYI